MKPVRLHPFSFLAGCALALLAFTAMAQKAAAPAAAASASAEYKIVDDVEAKDLARLASEGWEYAGYLGTGVKGSGNDETLWRKSSK